MIGDERGLEASRVSGLTPLRSGEGAPAPALATLSEPLEYRSLSLPCATEKPGPATHRSPAEIVICVATTPNTHQMVKRGFPLHIAASYGIHGRSGLRWGTLGIITLFDILEITIRAATRR